MKEKRVKKILNASYMNQKEASHKLNNLGYSYDPELSTNDSKVFVDKQGRPNIAFRGTHKGRLQDIISDLALATGLEKYDTRFKEAKHLTQLVESKYGKPVNTFGHSLGGTLAEKSGASGKITTLNKGTGILDIGKTIPSNQTDYRNRNDVASVLSLTQNHNGDFKQKQTNHGVFDILGNHKIE